MNKNDEIETLPMIENKYQHRKNKSKTTLKLKLHLFYGSF